MNDFRIIKSERENNLVKMRVRVINLYLLHLKKIWNNCFTMIPNQNGEPNWTPEQKTTKKHPQATYGSNLLNDFPI